MSRDRDRQAIALVACPRCGAAAGAPCLDLGGHPLGHHRPMAHTERRQAWQRARPGDPLDADIVMSDHAEGPPGRRATWVILAPLTPRGRAALPEGPRRVAHPDMRRTLADLRVRGLVVRREG